MLEIIKEYWTQIVFIVGIIAGALKMFNYAKKAIKCSLRNDILDIYDRCKETGKITHYQLESINHSADLYFKLKGNSFVKEVVKRANEFELID